MIEAVVIDLDGTLLNSKKTVSKVDEETLKLLKEKKVLRIVATGRSYFTTAQVLNHDFPIDYLIFSAGAGIMHYPTKEIFYKKFLSNKEVLEIVEHLSELRIDFQVRLKVPNGHKYYYRRYLKSNPDFDSLNHTYRDYVKPLIDTSILTEATRIIAISPNDENVNLIFNEFKKYSVVRATSPINNKALWMEIFPKNINKGSALSFLSEKLNFNLDKTVGLGNDYNDIDFLDITGQSFMVSNAPNVLKEKYEVTVSNNENPLTEILL